MDVAYIDVSIKPPTDSERMRWWKNRKDNLKDRPKERWNGRERRIGNKKTDKQPHKQTDMQTNVLKSDIY